LLTLLSGQVEPLYCHLHLAYTPLKEIQDLIEATEGMPEGGVPFDISEVPFLLSGRWIPHHRLPHDRGSETVVVTQFYASLLPLRGGTYSQPFETPT
jgi:hypothetical protein